MDYQFAQRISAAAEVDAVTYKQFLEWSEKEKADYLKDHPGSKFGRQHESGMTETKPYSQLRREKAQEKQAQKKAPEPKPAKQKLSYQEQVQQALKQQLDKEKAETPKPEEKKVDPQSMARRAALEAPKAPPLPEGPMSDEEFLRQLRWAMRRGR